MCWTMLRAIPLDLTLTGAGLKTGLVQNLSLPDGADGLVLIHVQNAGGNGAVTR